VTRQESVASPYGDSQLPDEAYRSIQRDSHLLRNDAIGTLNA
jgi:hypothetical protein